MRNPLLCSIQKFSLPLAGACLLSIAAHAAPLSVHLVATPPHLTPLSFLVGGRTLTTPSLVPNSFGSRDYTSQWPGSYDRAAFRGTSVYFLLGKSNEILHILADGKLAATLVKPTPGVYEIDGLSNSAHTVGVYVATESRPEPDTFGGFALPAHEKSLQLPHRSRQIEFIGDSHTVGYRNLAPPSPCEPKNIRATTDSTQTFGALTAHHYDADYQINAISGHGVVRNYNGVHEDTLPEAYPYILFNDKQKYNDPTWKPQVIVIALGTNDFSTKLHPTEPWKTRAALHADYESTYVHFLQQLRTRNPTATIIVWATHVRRGKENHNEAEDTVVSDGPGGEVEIESQKVVEQMQKQGDTRITYLPINDLHFGPCTGHPTIPDETRIADKLIHVIDADKDVWQNR